MPPHKSFVDRTGERYGRLTVVARDGNIGVHTAWLCMCDCGKQRSVITSSLKSGNTQSCGCSRRSPKPGSGVRLEPGESARRTLVKKYKSSARVRGLEWSVTDDNFIAITQLDCHYCGVVPSQVIATSSNGQFVYNGIDRIDNDIGYVSENLVSCCSICNRAKHAMPYHVFMMWLGRLAAHRNKSALGPISLDVQGKHAAVI
jgi:5-methylcytosine-specific restriction endonuclease McrA